MKNAVKIMFAAAAMLVLAVTGALAAENMNDKLADAAGIGDTKAVLELLKQGADVDGRETRGDARRTPLLIAASNGQVDAARILLEHGANVNATDSDNTNSLSYASSRGDIDMVDLLLEHGADVNAKDGVERTPLMWAAEAGHSDVVFSLIKKGADVNFKNVDGVTALSLAEDNRRKEVIRLLSTAGATPTAGVHAPAQAPGQTPAATK